MGRGRGAGTRARDRDVAVAAGPRLPAPSTACTTSFTVAPRAEFQVAQMHLDLRSPAVAGQGDQLARTWWPSSVTKKPSVPAGPSSRGVTHETIASPAAGWPSRFDAQAARGGRRPAVVSAERRQ